jgi:hypothetical protein
MEGTPRNARRYPRIRTERPIKVSLLDPEGILGVTTTRTVGLGGCMFVHPTSLGAGTVVGLEIDAGKGRIVTTARVVYELFQGGDGYEVGVEFLTLSDEESQLLEEIVEGKDSPASP